eukprot:TRINITY_DN32098_c0_g1_i1.p1 TRINITY_DN32098_c0_g1~~TRINITY_DN32098_c0_g1_i1.p1  ORF type:complete len:880 (+),score=270.03 TRINITY_DN32098_c0_g1_i1:73-2640(+)
MRLSLRSVSGQRFEVDVAPGDKLSSLLTSICETHGYQRNGAKLVHRGSQLDVSQMVADVLDDGDVVFFVATKAVYGPGRGSDTPRAAAAAGSPHHRTPAREKATEQDFSGDKYSGPLPIAHRQGAAQLCDALERRGAGIDAEFEELLRIHPSMTHIRKVVQADSSMLEPILRQIQAVAPRLVEAIGQFPEAFLRILNAQVGAAPEEDAYAAEHQQMWEYAADSTDAGGSEEGEGDGDQPVNLADVELTEEEEEAVGRVVNLGEQNGMGPFPRELVIQVFMDAGRNEHLTAQYLIELATFDPLAFALAQRQAALHAQQQQQLLSQQQEQQGAATGDQSAQAEATSNLPKDLAQHKPAVAAARSALKRGGDVDAAALLQALEAALPHTASVDESRQVALELHSEASHLLLSHAAAASDQGLQLCVHEHAALAACVEQNPASAGTLLARAETGAALTVDRLRAIARREGADCVLVHCAEGRLVVWQIHHDTPAAAPGGITLRRSTTLGPREAATLRSAPRELAQALAATSGSAALRVWAALHRLHSLLLGDSTEWVPRRVHFASSLAVPFHALAPHGGVSLGRGRVVTQSPSLIWLEHAQLLAQRPVTGGRTGPLRSAAAVDAFPARRPAIARLQPQTLVPLDGLGEQEPVAVWHVAVTPAQRPPGPADLVVANTTPNSEAERGWDTCLDQWDSKLSAAWCCSACIPLLPPVPAADRVDGQRSQPLPPAPAPPPCSGGVPTVLCRLLAEGRRKTDAYAAAVAAASEGPPQGWVPWVFVGTSLALGGRRAHIDPSALRQTQGYKFLDQHSMHRVFDSMARFLLKQRPEDPIDALLSFMEENQEGLQKMSKTSGGGGGGS